MRTLSVLREVLRERHAQNRKWGEQNHPDGNFHRWLLGASFARDLCNAAVERGRLTWCHILYEEVAEAFEAVANKHLRAELVQVAAVAVAWIEAIDRREGK